MSMIIKETTTTTRLKPYSDHSFMITKNCCYYYNKYLYNFRLL